MEDRRTSHLKQTVFALTCLFIATLTANPTYAQIRDKGIPKPAINFDTSKWDSVKVHALKAGLPIFVFFYSNGCEHCERERTNVLTDKGIGNYFNSHFVNTMVESTTPTARDFIVKYGITQYPSFLLFDRGGSPIHMETGELPIPDVLNFGEKILTPNACYFLVKKAYESGDHSVYTCYNYALAAAYIDKLAASKAGEEYFKQQNDSLTITRNWVLINKLSFRSDLIGYKLLKQHRAEFIKKFSDTLINHAIYNSTTATINEAARRHDSAMYRTTVGGMNGCTDSSFMFQYITNSLYYFHRMHMPDSFMAMAVRTVPKYMWNDPIYLNSTVHRLLDITTNAADYPRAEVWIKRAFALSKDATVYETYATLLMREGKHDEALKMANEGLEKGKATNAYIGGLVALKNQLDPPKKQ